MKRALLSIGLLTILAGCGSSKTLVWDLSLPKTDASRSAVLLKGAERIVVRRLAASQVDRGVSANAVPTAVDRATLTVTVPDAAAAEKASAILREPFTFDIRKEQPATAATGGSDTAGQTVWVPTGIEGHDLEWVQVVRASNGNVGIELLFSATGRTKLAALLKESAGGNIGIFVRDILVSSLEVKRTAISDHIVIDGVPSEMVAQIFADDVNVGLHVTFTPAR